MEDRIKVCEEKMEKSLNALVTEYASIRAGRANPHVLDKIKVDYYGVPSALQQVANVSVPEARMIQIQPWEKSLLKAIEKAILTSDLGINPTNDGVAAAICDIIQTEKRAAIGDPNYELTKDDVLAYYNNTYKPIYVRLRSQVTGIPDVPVEGTDYLSNVVEYKNVAVSYMALSIPDKNAEFYLRGTMNNWGNGEGDFNGWEFYTTKVKGTYITNVVTMPKGTEFKIADATWGAINLGGPASVGVDEKDAITIGTPDGNNMTLGQDF